MEPPALKGAPQQSSAKERGAFFTPSTVAQFVADWAIRSGSDVVLEPSCGESAFLVGAASRFVQLAEANPTLIGVEIDQASVELARSMLYPGNLVPDVVHSDFFDYQPRAQFDVVIGNPPFIRFHQFSGAARAKAQAAALRRGVRLSGRASSWAAFVLHAAGLLKPGGRLGFVLPVEFLHVDYAVAVRKFVLENFTQVDIVSFESRVFDDAQTDVVLLLADGFGQGRTDHARLFDATGKDGLDEVAFRKTWQADPDGNRWSAARMPDNSQDVLQIVSKNTKVRRLADWGELSIGVVTGSNGYFTLSEEDRLSRGLAETELLALAPPLKPMELGLAYSIEKWQQRRDESAPVWLFAPGETPSPEALDYIEEGEQSKVDEGYKCQNRKPWWRVPVGQPGQIMFGYMSSGPLRLIHNPEQYLHLNSVHRLRVPAEFEDMCGDLALAALNSMTLLSAESSGRTYGGGVLKMEIGEARSLLVPSTETVRACMPALSQIRRRVGQLSSSAELFRALDLVDQAILVDGLGISARKVSAMRAAHVRLRDQRHARSRGPVAPKD